MLTPKKQIFRKLPFYWLEAPSKEALAPLLIFLHGFPDDANVWERQIEYFKKHYYVLAPFLPGTYEGSPAAVQRYRPESFGIDVLTLIHQVDPKRQRHILLVGHDLGGGHAEYLAKSLEDRLLGLVYMNSMGLHQFVKRASNLAQLKKSSYMLAFQVPTLPAFFMNLFHLKFKKMAYDKGGLAADDPIRKYGRSSFRALSQYKAYFRQGLALRKQAIKKENFPVLFLCGEDDPFLELPSLDEVERFYSNVEIRVLEAGHWMFRDQAERINEILEKTFIKWNHHNARSRSNATQTV